MPTSAYGHDIDTRPVVYIEDLKPKQIEQLMRLPHTTVGQIVKGRISPESRETKRKLTPRLRQRRQVT